MLDYAHEEIKKVRKEQAEMQNEFEDKEKSYKQ